MVSDEEEEGYGSTSGTPVKHVLTKKGKKPARKHLKALEVEQIDDSDNAIDPDATEEEMEFEVNEVMQVDHLAAQVLYDPATRYRCASKEVLDCAKAFWMGPIIAKSTHLKLMQWSRPNLTGNRLLVNH